MACSASSAGMLPTRSAFRSDMAPPQVSHHHDRPRPGASPCPPGTCPPGTCHLERVSRAAPAGLAAALLNVQVTTSAVSELQRGGGRDAVGKVDQLLVREADAVPGLHVDHDAVGHAEPEL